jgi:hypothetical protein
MTSWHLEMRASSFNPLSLMGEAIDTQIFPKGFLIVEFQLLCLGQDIENPEGRKTG